MRARRFALAVATAAIAIGACAGVARVAWLEAREVTFERRTLLGDGARDDGTRLARLQLRRDQRVVFELCADDPMRPERWADAIAVAIWRPRANELMTRSALTDEVLALAQRSETSACLVIGQGLIAADDEYAVEALWDDRPDAIAAVPLTLRVLARVPLAGIDRAVVIATWLGSLLFVLAWAGRRRVPLGEAAAIDRSGAAETGAAREGAPFEEVASATTDARRTEARAMSDGAPVPVGAFDRTAEIDDGAAAEWEAVNARPKLVPELRVAAGVLLLIASFVASALVPAGAAAALATGVGLALFQAVIAIALASRGRLAKRLAVIALVPPARGWQLGVAALAGVALWVNAMVATQLVPSTSRSAVQTFVSWPSGMLSFAVLAVLAPLAEEIFFRGFVYGALRERSRVLAFAGGSLLFVLAHAPQTWGQWGALLAIGVTGTTLTALRASTGSTLPPAVAHLTYNGLLAFGAVL